MSKKSRILSPSRIDTLTKCTWSYWCNYHLKLPETNNDGARRGSIIHDLYECLVKNRSRHEWKFDKMLEHNNIYKVPCIDRFIRMKARQYGLSLDSHVVKKNRAGIISNRDYLNEMTLVGLKSDFYGREGDKIISEKQHIMDVDKPESDIRYKVRGFIDKIFIRENEDGSINEVEIVDYKSSKMKFSEKSMESNMQGIIYQFFALDLYSFVKKLSMKFLFLQFPRSPWVEARPIPKYAIKGIEVYLTRLYRKINNFTEKDAKVRFAKHHGMHHFCGKRGMKLFKHKTIGKIVSPEKNWMCPYKEPFEYFCLVDQEGEIVKSAFSKDELDVAVKNGYKVEKRKYHGCPAWNADPKQVKRFWGILS